jgi:hypothetical protein
MVGERDLLSLFRNPCQVLEPYFDGYYRRLRPVTDSLMSLTVVTTNTPVEAMDGSPGRPVWDARRRELRWDGKLVKRFRTPASCQECILAAFEEDGWPPQIDDPLPPGGTQTPQDRLHDAVRALNGHQLDARIHFFRDGTGQGICWEPAAPRKRRGRVKRGR